MSKYVPLSTTLARNTTQKCKLNGCPKPRYKLARHCRLHSDRNRRWGHPVAGRCWRKNHIQAYREVADAFLLDHTEHVGVVAAIAWLDACLQTAQKEAKTPKARGRLHRSLRHLGDSGVDGTEILSQVLAAFFYMLEQPEADGLWDVLIANTGHHVLRSAPRFHRGELQKKYAKELGRYLFTGLKSFLLSVVVHYKDVQTAERNHEAALSAPFGDRR